MESSGPHTCHRAKKKSRPGQCLRVPLLQGAWEPLNVMHGLFVNLCAIHGDVQSRVFIGFSKESLIQNEALKSRMEYHSALKKNEIMAFASEWMELENIMLSEIS